MRPVARLARRLRPPFLAPVADLLRDQLQATLGTAYTLERELGGGGMSRVFVAREEALGRDVVVKVLAPELAQGLSAERFAREIRLAAALQEPHIVPVHAAGATAEGLPYYTMPYVHGESLRARLAEGSVPLGEAVRVLRDVALALAYAHRQGVVHRDVKPENVLLSSGTAVVTDFGIAKALQASRTQAPDGTLTQRGTSLGTPAYMAPEQAVGDGVDHRADLYAWGVLAYELLAGRHPFAGKVGAQQLLAAHLTEAPVPLDAAMPGTPGPLAAVVMRCLAKSPPERPASADEIVRALDAITRPAAGTAAGGDLPAGSPADVAAARPGRRRAAAALVLVLVLAAAGITMSRRSTARATDAGVVAVLPFRVAAADPSLTYLREGMLDLLAAKLADRPRALDPRVVLAAWRRAGGDERTDPERGRALALAAALGAGRLLEGEVVGSASRVVLAARLLEAPGGGERARASATGAAADLAVLVDSLAARLLALDAGEHATIASALGGIPLPALQAYLAGQTAIRAGEYQRAVDAYARAIEIDSTFALAAVRLAGAAAWVYDPRGGPARELAIRHRARLGARDRWLLPHEDARSRPTTHAAAIDRLEQAVTAVPDLPELWFGLGDLYFHHGPALGQPDADRRAARAFERALALDSTFRPALEHLPILYAWLGDSAAVQRSMALMERDTTGDFLPVTQWALAANGAARRSAMERLLRGPVTMALVAASFGPEFSLGSETMAWTVEHEELLRRALELAASPADQRMAAQLAYMVASNRGQRAKAARAYGAFAAEGAPASALDAVFWDADSAAVAPRLAALARLAASPAPAQAGGQRARWAEATFIVAQAALARGDTAHARAAVRRLLAPPAVDTLPLAAETARRFALLLDAQLAARTRRPDAAARLSSLDSLLRLAPVETTVQAVGNLVAARLWEDRGDPTRAYAAVRRTGRGPAFTPFFSTYLHERARLAAALGDRDTAIREYRRYLSVRRDADPALDPHLGRVREVLMRLERESTGR